MLIVVIATASYEDAEIQIQQSLAIADGVELRLDYFQALDFFKITRLCALCTLPVIFTLRSKAQGGFYKHSECPCTDRFVTTEDTRHSACFCETERLKHILHLCTLAPDYFDLEYHVSDQSIQEINNKYPQVKLIRSYHDFQSTPQDLMSLLCSMFSPSFHAYKIVTQAQCTSDALSMLDFARQASKAQRLSAFCMGAKGIATRILAPVVGTWMTYTYLENTQPVVTGQLSIQNLLTIYHYRRLNVATKIYALIGDPVDLSVGHLLHNQVMSELNENAVYIKLCLTVEELRRSWHFFQIPMWAGMSVTMPLKEKITSYLDSLENDSVKIQAVNTLIQHEGHWHGMNTDGRGAWQALAPYLNGKNHTLLILGAGGAARAIAYEAKRQGVKSFIVNRTLAKAQRLAQEIDGEAYELSFIKDLKSHYTLIINTLPVSAFSSIALLNDVLNPNAIAMDIIYQPIQTPFLKWASKAGCRCVFGYEMYIYQALLQIQQWFQVETSVLENIKLMMYRTFKF